MALLLRMIAPKFDPGATVENAGVGPVAAPEEDIAVLDARLVNLLHAQPALSAEMVDGDAPAQVHIPTPPTS